MEMQIVGSLIVIGFIIRLLWIAYGDLQEKLRRREVKERSRGKIIVMREHPKTTGETINRKSRGEIINIKRRKQK